MNNYIWYYPVTLIVNNSKDNLFQGRGTYIIDLNVATLYPYKHSIGDLKVGRKAYEKPRLIHLGKVSELANTGINCKIESSSRDQTIDDLLLKIDARKFTDRIKEKLKEVEIKEK